LSTIGVGDTEKTVPPKWRGHVTEILPQEIFVPSPYAKLLTGLAAHTAEAPRYAITLCYGHTVEPWVGDVKLILGTGAITSK
jgi:hypothetical protein